MFSHLARHKKPTLLSTTYRLNAPLAHWPSEQFYHGELRSAVPHHRLALKQSPKRYSHLLDPADSLVHMVIDCPGSRSRNDEEADHVAQIVHDLLTSGLSPEEIGIVTPFRAQASRIRTLLHGDRFKARSSSSTPPLTVSVHFKHPSAKHSEKTSYTTPKKEPARRMPSARSAPSTLGSLYQKQTNIRHAEPMYKNRGLTILTRTV